MQNLIQQLEQPRHNSDGKSFGPSNLDRRAARTIKELVTVNQTNSFVIKTMQKDLDSIRKELNEIKNFNDIGNTHITSTDTQTDSAQYTLFD